MTRLRKSVLPITLKSVVAISAVLASGYAHSWVHSSDVQIAEVIEWEGSSSPIYIRLSNNTLCWLPHTEERLYSLILTAFAAGKAINIHCHADTSTYLGYVGHKVHRVIVLN